MRAVIEKVNIRGCEPRENKKGEPYLLVHFADDSGKIHNIVDKDMERYRYYRRGATGTLIINIDTTSRYTTVRVADFKERIAEIE